MAALNTAELEAEFSRVHLALLTALVANAVQKQTGKIVEDEQPDPRNQGVHTGGGRSGGPFNPRD
jgi:hypothetical protein